MNYQYLEAYIAMFERLAPDMLDELGLVVTDDIHFVDPFNDVRGFTAMSEIFVDMYRRTKSPKFVVLDWSVNGVNAYVRWRFTAGLPVLGEFKTLGVSHLIVDEEGKVKEHIDYWDSAPIYMRVPLIGRLIKALRSRMAA
jgi:steroid delta-isomerase